MPDQVDKELARYKLNRLGVVRDETSATEDFCGCLCVPLRSLRLQGTPRGCSAIAQPTAEKRGSLARNLVRLSLPSTSAPGFPAFSLHDRPNLISLVPVEIPGTSSDGVTMDVLIHGR